MSGVNFLFCSLAFLLTWIYGGQALRVQGHYASPVANWVFIDRFCFLSEDGRIEYDFSFPKEYDQYIAGSFHPQNIILYFDDQWEHIYPGNVTTTCEDRLAVLKPENHQVINLTTRYYWSGCNIKERVHTGGDSETYLECKGGRTFTSRRPRWWYIVLANCGSEKGLSLNYKLNMTNTKEFDIFRRHMSADEYYILEELIVAIITYFTMTVLTLCVAVALSERQLFHTTYKLYMTSVYLMMASIVCQIIYWTDFGRAGFPKKNWKDAGRAFDFVSHCVFLTLLILMSKGYTITRARIRPLGVIKLVIFAIVYLAATVAMFFYERSFNKGLVLYFYQSIPGYVLVGLKILAWCWCLFGIIFTIKHYPEKKRFYIPFFVTITLWFWLGPIMILVANFAMPSWIREKIIHGIMLGLTALGHVIFLFLTWPTHANSTFPYHIRTTQIGVMPPPSSNARDTHNPAREGGAYAPSMENSANTSAPTGERNFLAMFGAANAQTGMTESNGTGPANQKVNPDHFPREIRSPLQPDS